MIKAFALPVNVCQAEHDVDGMPDPSANSSRSNPKEAPLLFVSTNTAVFSDTSRTAARSHAAAWSRRRLKEAKAKSKARKDAEHTAKSADTEHATEIVDTKHATEIVDTKHATEIVDAEHATEIADAEHAPKIADAEHAAKLVDAEHAAKIAGTLSSPQLPSSSESGMHQALQHDSTTNDKNDCLSIKRQPDQLSASARRRDPKQRVWGRRGIPFNRDSSSLPLVVCGKNGTLDPFDCLAVKVDSNAYELLQFYKCTPMAWNSHPFASNQDSLGSDIVNVYMSSKLQFYTFLCLSAAMMDAIGNARTNFSIYSHWALTEMQKQLRQEHFNEQELLHGVSTLSIAAILQGDVVAARAHFQAARHLVDRLGGLEASAPLISQLIKYGDFHLAIQTLCPPVFALNFEPEELPEQDHCSNRILDQMGYNALQFSRGHRLPWLFENVQRIIQCAKVLEGIWAQPALPVDKKVTWLAAKIGSSINRLLSTLINTATDLHARRVQEATKVVLILWNLITLGFAKNVVADIPVRGSMLVFTDSTLEMREDWPPWIKLGLMSWNEIVRSPSLERDNRGPFWSLINLVRSMEAESLVQLAGLMHRLYQLEDIYLMQKQQGRDLELVLRCSGPHYLDKPGLDPRACPMTG